MSSCKPEISDDNGEWVATAVRSATKERRADEVIE